MKFKPRQVDRSSMGEDNVLLEFVQDGEVQYEIEAHNEPVRTGWDLFPVLFASGGTLTYKINKMKCGSSTQVVQVSDGDLISPWAMSYITADRSYEDVTSLFNYYGIPPNVYTGQVLSELGFYYDIVTGSSPITVPAMYARTKLPSPITMVADYGVQVTHAMGWNNV